MSNDLVNQIVVSGIEALLVAVLLLSLFRLRARLGLSLLYVTLGVFQPIQMLLASSIYIQFQLGWVVSPGSAILFTAGLFTILLVYIREDALEARKVIYGILVANLTMTLLLFGFGIQLGFSNTLNFLNLPPEIFNQGARVMLTGTITLFCDVLLVIFVYEALRRFIPKSAFLRIYLTMAIILTFDTLLFIPGIFHGQGDYSTLIYSGIVGKAGMAIFYAAVLTIYLRYIEPAERLDAVVGQPFQDIFYALTYREKYEIERMRTEAVVRESEKKLRDIIAHSADGIVITDENGTITIWNHSLEQITNLASGEMLGKPIWDAHYQLLPESQRTPECYRQLKEDLRAYLATGESPWVEALIEREIEHTDEPQPCVQERIFPIKTNRGYMLGSIIRDVTEEKRAEEVLQQYTYQLETLNKVSAALTSSLSIEAVLELILEQAQIVLPFDCATIFLKEAGGLHVVVDWGFAISAVGKVYPENNLLFSEIETSGEPLVLDSPLDDPRFENWGASEDIRTWMGVPLLVRDKLIGIMTLDSDQLQAYVPEQIPLVKSFAAHAAQAIDNARQFSDAQRRLERLSSLQHIDLAITNYMDLPVTLEIVLGHVLQQLDVSAAAILLCQPDTRMLEFIAGQGFRTQALKFTKIPMGKGFAGIAALERRVVHIADSQQIETRFSDSREFHKEQIVAYLGVPLISKGNIIGVLEIYNRQPLDPEGEWMDFLDTLAGQAAIAIDNISLFNDLQRTNLELMQAYDATIEGWAHALEMRDMETVGHSRRVVDLTLELARELGIEKAQLINVRRGALLHDIGKMGIPDAILQKPGKLTEQEWTIMRQHPVYAFEWLSSIDYLRSALDIPYRHHEKWDGSGYPNGLKGEEIPLAARIFAVIDVWDALSSDRPYRKAWPPEQIMTYLQEQTGQHFDPRVVEAFMEIMNGGGGSEE